MRSPTQSDWKSTSSLDRRDTYVSELEPPGRYNQFPSIQRDYNNNSHNTTQHPNSRKLHKLFLHSKPFGSQNTSHNNPEVIDESSSLLVQRSISLSSLRSSSSSSAKRSHRSKTVSSGVNRRSTLIGGKLSEMDLPADIVAQLEADTLHGNLRRDSFRSRGGTKHFVSNPLFDEDQSETLF